MNTSVLTTCSHTCKYCQHKFYVMKDNFTLVFEFNVIPFYLKFIEIYFADCSWCIRQYLAYKTQCPCCFLEITDQGLRPVRVLDNILKCFPVLKKKVLENWPNDKQDKENNVKPTKTSELTNELNIIKPSLPKPITSTHTELPLKTFDNDSIYSSPKRTPNLKCDVTPKKRISDNKTNEVKSKIFMEASAPSGTSKQTTLLNFMFSPQKQR